jgi:autotransporter translocation and assembly factor TamB
MKPLVKKALWWSGLSTGSLLVLVVGFACWLLFTTSGARWAAGMATSRFAPQVRYATLDGTLAGELTLTDFRFKGPPDAAHIRIERMSVEPTLMMLLSRTLRIENARVQGLLVTLPENPAPEDPDKPDTGMWIAPPLEIIVDDFALLDGRIVKGGENLFALKQLDVSARWNRDELRIDKLTLLPGDIEGDLAVRGRITPAEKLVRGVLDVKWSRVVLPASYAGRELHSQGEIHFDGTPKAYAVTGELDAGPSGEPTHAVLDVQGTDARADIRKLQLVQKAGQLALDGHVQFQPVAWQLHAKAREFDPGMLLAGWNGKVNLDANTRGQMLEAGPSGSLQLLELNGDLRGRPIAGEGDIEFAAPSRLAGDLKLSSGKSRVAVKGNATSGNEVDATVKLAVTSLADWVRTRQVAGAGDRRCGRWPKPVFRRKPRGAPARGRGSELAAEARR